MIVPQSFILIILVISVRCVNEDLVDRLVNLVQDEISRAYTKDPLVNSYEYIPKSNRYREYGTFDHIVVGAGSAGAVVANRLSEDIFRNVLLVEAGGPETDFTDISVMLPVVLGLPELIWNYTTIPQRSSCLGSSEKRCAYPRGRGLGGSSIINGALYTRGNKNDFDEWGKQGNLGWTYKDVLPYFKKIENYPQGNPKYHGKGGYLNLQSASSIDNEYKALLDAHLELGGKLVNYNDEEQMGVGILQYNLLKGKRHSTGRAYLDPIKDRANLKILTNSYVVKIVINKYKKAYGVIFSKDGFLYLARSRYDIVISAGSIASPQLLMLSGIGPEKHLKSLGIPIIQNLAVGENVEDHPCAIFLNFITNITKPEVTVKQNIEDYLNGTGPFTTPLNTKVILFSNTGNSFASVPDIELLLISDFDDFLYPKIFNVDPDLVKSKTDPSKLKFTVNVILLHPKSKGTVRLQSPNPFLYPLIDTQMLSDRNNEDIETIYRGIQMLFDLINTTAFKKIGVQYLQVTHPNCQTYPYGTRDYWYCYIRHFSGSTYHLISSCKMGLDPAKGAVVSPSLKVFGIENLRVADASIMPSSISGHTNAATIMIGEKAADLIHYGMYDHIIIGAGSAGATIASRLSEDSFRNILLVEAGGSESDFTDIPSMAPFVVGLPEYNWKSSSVPQKNCCLGAKEKRCAYHRGKGLGGSSLINLLTYTRGNKHDYNNWSAMGCSGWGYEDVLPFFKKIENFAESVSKFRGKEGFLNVETNLKINDADQAFIDANKELGRKFVDYNAEQQIGVSTIQFNRLNGKRHSIAKAYLEPVRHRRNLNVLTNSYVIKILINKRKKAYGILFSKNGVLYTARSRSDIIVSAGSIGSPHLLMLSGIGPESHLKEMGITVKQNLAVGNDTEDHPVTLLLHFVSNRNATHTTLKENINNYLKSTGPFTDPINSNAIAFLNTGTSLNKAPDLELMMSSFDDGNIDLRVFNINKELYENISKTDPNKAKFLIMLFLLHPKSKGIVRLRSRNPFDYPLIDPRMLSDENNSDIETLFQGIQLVFRITNTTAFKKMGAEYLYASHPDCQKFSFETRDYWYCNIRYFTTAAFHLVGSCKMGPNPVTTGAVVNPQLKVFGIQNLRVGDASIIPTSISGHTNAVAIMIGEKLAALIRNDL
ncbi:hypothetical protein FQA39_LY06042 [Lamprigera yunnana]|nr:hypothetical protein FQA39_LY06042 [Lamprigera yunnana]